MPDSNDSLSTRLLARLERTERLLVILAFALLIGIIFADVMSRELRGAGLYWATQSGVWANVLIVMAGFGLASSDGAHLRPRFADNWLPDAWAEGIVTAQHAVMSIFCVAAAGLSAVVVFGSWQLGEVSLDLFVPVWPVQSLVPLALLVAAIRHGIYAAVPHTRPAETGALVLSGRGDT